MALQTVSIQNVWTGLSRRVAAVGVRRFAVFYALLLALFLSGTVPQGFMRAADGDGMAIVLCTPDGASEVWLSENGEIHSEAPADGSSPERSGCLAVTVVLTAVQGVIGTLGQTIEFAPFRMVLADRRGSIAPALTPLQPRAPPIVI